MSLELVFKKTTDARFDFIRSQHKAKVDDHGILVREAIPMPFSKAEFVAWILKQFGGNVDAPIPCYYCRRWIDVGSYSVDHETPRRDGGTSEFSNLRLCCIECNSSKGDLTGEVYIKLVLLIKREFDRQSAARIMSRIKMGNGYKRLAFIQRKGKKALPAVPQFELPDNF